MASLTGHQEHMAGLKDMVEVLDYHHANRRRFISHGKHLRLLRLLMGRVDPGLVVDLMLRKRSM
jgi:hypothetical protein